MVTTTTQDQRLGAICIKCVLAFVGIVSAITAAILVWVSVL